MAAISSVQCIARAVHPEVVQKGLPNMLIPNNLLQHPMTGWPKNVVLAPWVYGKRSLTYRRAKLWNELDYPLSTPVSIDIF